MGLLARLQAYLPDAAFCYADTARCQTGFLARTSYAGFEGNQQQGRQQLRVLPSTIRGGALKAPALGRDQVSLPAGTAYSSANAKRETVVLSAAPWERTGPSARRTASVAS